MRWQEQRRAADSKPRCRRRGTLKYNRPGPTEHAANPTRINTMQQDFHSLIEEARRYIPGGVNSPVRAFGSVGGDPVFFERAEGAWLTDVNGKRYVDYVGSWGPML